MYLATYARYWRINLLTILEYRANFLMWAAFTAIYHATAIIVGSHGRRGLRRFGSRRVDGWGCC